VKRMLDVLQGIITLAVVVAVVIILADAALVFFEARPGNEVVAFFSDTAEPLVPNPVVDVLPDQEHWQTALLSLAAYAVVLVAFAVLFRFLRWIGDRYAYRARR
jgi:hypothetical protein